MNLSDHKKQKPAKYAGSNTYLSMQTEESFYKFECHEFLTQKIATGIDKPKFRVVLIGTYLSREAISAQKLKFCASKRHASGACLGT